LFVMMVSLSRSGRGGTSCSKRQAALAIVRTARLL
jgi:hypothetical protein